MAKNARPFKATFSSLMRHWLVCGLLGMFIPSLVYSIIQLDYFEQWQRFPTAPPNAVELLENPFAATVRTADGQILTWDSYYKRWIPDVIEEDPWTLIQSCNQYPTAFNASTHPPESLLTCAALHYGDFVGYGFTVLYAIDQQGYVWEWHKPSTIGFPALAFIGAGAGIIIGSLIWLVRRWLVRREQGKAFVQPVEPIIPEKRSWIWVLALLPIILCVGMWLIILVEYLTLEYKADQITQSPSLNAYATQNAVWYSAPPATPNPTGPAYNFAAECANARLNYDFPGSGGWNCGDSRLPDQASVSIIQNPPGGEEWSGQALRLYLPVQERGASIRYPNWLIHPGEHFRTTLVCSAEIVNCDLTFRAYLEFQEENKDYSERIELGTWRLTNEQRSQEIDIDLSQFAGKIVSVVLETINSDPIEIEQVVPQIALWVNPRVEYLPGE